MASVLRVTVLELPATSGHPHAALEHVDGLLAHGPETDLVLLPEASLTGYVSARGDFDLTRHAEPLDGPTARGIAELAQRHRTHLVAPLVLSEKGALYNAMVGFDRAGRHMFTYRKQHPWFPETWATPGVEAAPMRDIEGVRVTIATCYDVHFLEDERAEQLDAADLLLFPSAWVEERDSRPELLAGLARRHGIAIANANWGPGVVTIAGQGSSSILDATGATVVSVATRERVIRADATLELPRVGAR